MKFFFVIILTILIYKSIAFDGDFDPNIKQKLIKFYTKVDMSYANNPNHNKLYVNKLMQSLATCTTLEELLQSTEDLWNYFMDLKEEKQTTTKIVTIKKPFKWG
jgi:hypothetical protein